MLEIISLKHTIKPNILMDTDYKILLFYKYIKIDNPTELMNEQKALWAKLNLKGRMIIATEGINATLEGANDDIERYLEAMKSDARFADVDYKDSPGTGNAFPRASIKVRNEVVTLGLDDDQDIDPNQTTGTHLSPEELHEWFESGKEFYIIDMRNDYEQKVGHFKNSILPSLGSFRDLPDVLPELESYKDKTVVTFCTGGIRCEKASGYLITQGFKDVYQLGGGIHRYIEKYPNTNFLGKLYVFDGRITMAINADSEDHVIIGKCDLCEEPCDDYTNCLYPRCNKHIIACTNCRDEDGNAFCSDECREAMQSYNGKPNGSFRVNQQFAS